MNALIIGGDYIDQIKKAMSDAGVRTTDHWTGRKSGDLRRSVPEGVDVIVVLTDFVSHPMLKHLREQAAHRHTPVVYCRRTVADVRDKVTRFVAAQGREMRLAG